MVSPDGKELKPHKQTKIKIKITENHIKTGKIHQKQKILLDRMNSDSII